MKKRLTALLLTLALLTALGALTAVAEGETSEETPAASDAEPAAAAEPAEQPEAAAETELPEPEPSPDPEGTLSFENLESRIRSNDYTLLSLERRIESIDETDLAAIRRQLVDGINEISDQQWGMRVTMGALGSVAAGMLQSSYDSLNKQLDDLKSGKTAKDMADARRQLTAAEDQFIMSMESAYIQLKAAQTQDAALTRTIAALDRGAQAARVSCENGLVSKLAVEQLASQRAQLVSGQKTLRMGIDTGMMNLKAMVGEDLDAPLTLAALPKVTAEQLDAMELEADLSRAKEQSCDLYNAKKTLEDAREDFNASNRSASAQRTWEAAQYTYENAQQSFELRFRTLYAQVKDNAQKLDAAKSALSMEERNYQVSALKYRQQTISQNALADAGDTLADAKDAVASAERDLLSSYRSYCWAVERGILNG